MSTWVREVGIYRKKCVLVWNLVGVGVVLVGWL